MPSAALFKQATLGEASASAGPGLLAGPEARYKHAAWSKLRGLSGEDAQARYVDVIAITILATDAVVRPSLHIYRTLRHTHLLVHALDSFPFLTVRFVSSQGLPSRAWYDEQRARGDDAPAFLRDVWGSDTPAGDVPPLWAAGRALGGAVAAVARLEARGALAATDALALKALRWQGNFGDVLIDRPGLLGGLAGLLSAAEWDAWNALRGMPQAEALETYICKAEELTEA